MVGALAVCVSRSITLWAATHADGHPSRRADSRGQHGRTVALVVVEVHTRHTGDTQGTGPLKHPHTRPNPHRNQQQASQLPAPHHARATMLLARDSLSSPSPLQAGRERRSTHSGQRGREREQGSLLHQHGQTSSPLREQAEAGRQTCTCSSDRGDAGKPAPRCMDDVALRQAHCYLSREPGFHTSRPARFAAGGRVDVRARPST